ncbi:response regulator [Solitalea koreensis]|uniref:Response regulator receiver domain-containing protein n=1 Tax=Solitalea koreensis TaxID=543615 RepID=A0A521DAA3_9SPHI|nr:response regulator [Solitalea koreensis]SMO68532.1 Response regulator receiver domain-containing protein [Solitalea koreensis]
MKSIDNLCVIDDDKVCQFIIKTYAAKRSLAKNMQLFSDANEALQYLKNTSTDPKRLPDMILLDINMPIMDGWTFLEEFQKIRENMHKDIIINMITSSIQEDDMLKSKSYSDVAGFYVKPLNEELIINMFEHLPVE